MFYSGKIYKIIYSLFSTEEDVRQGQMLHFWKLKNSKLQVIVQGLTLYN